MQATYEHDCGHCVLVAIDTPRPGELNANAVDVYRHIARDGQSITIRRFSSEPSNYYSRLDCHATAT